MARRAPTARLADDLAPAHRDLFTRRVRKDKEPNDRNAEARVQAAVVQWIGWVAPQLIVYAIPNGGYRTKAEAARLRWTGVLAGIPDLGFVLPGGQAGFFEIKPPKRGHLSDEQAAMLPRLETLGARCAVVRSIEDARAALTAWGIETREVRASA
jgi:hypothetical protein